MLFLFMRNRLHRNIAQILSLTHPCAHICKSPASTQHSPLQIDQRIEPVTTESNTCSVHKRIGSIGYWMSRVVVGERKLRLMLVLQEFQVSLIIAGYY